MIKKFKNTLPWTYVINDLDGQEIVGIFYKKELQKANQKESRIEKVIERKVHKLYVIWKGYNNVFNSRIYKKDKKIVWMSEYFPESKSSGRRVDVEFYLSNYATKSDLKTATGLDSSKFAKKIHWSSKPKI